MSLISPLLAGRKQSTSKCCLASSAQMPSYFQICQLGISTTASAPSCKALFHHENPTPTSAFPYFSPVVSDPRSTWSDPPSTFRIPLHHMAFWTETSEHKVVPTFQAWRGFLSEGFRVAFHSNGATFLLLNNHWLEAHHYLSMDQRDQLELRHLTSYLSNS